MKELCKKCIYNNDCWILKNIQSVETWTSTIIELYECPKRRIKKWE